MMRLTMSRNTQTLIIASSPFGMLNMGFLTLDIADIWTAIETYPFSAQLSRGNCSYKCDLRVRSINKKCMPIPRLPVNFYHSEWLYRAPPSFQSTIKEDVAHPTLVSHNAFILSGAQTHCCTHKVPYNIHRCRENMNTRDFM
jgi:hypothetical protein